MSNLFRVPPMSRGRMIAAMAVAVGADGLQLALGPLGWAFFDEAIDVVTMVLVSGIVGFHILFLPTFVIELIPVADMMPTWTGCVAAVIAMRKRESPAPSTPAPAPNEIILPPATVTPTPPVIPTPPNLPGASKKSAP